MDNETLDFDGNPIVRRPYTDDELAAIRQRLEAGDIPGGEKYAVIQRLIHSHMLCNRLRIKDSHEREEYSDAVETIGDILRNVLKKKNI